MMPSVQAGSTMEHEGTVIYTWHVCPYAQRVRILLAEKAVELPQHEIDLDAGKPDWLREISPLGEVPVLMHGGKAIWDSTAISSFLDEIFPSPSLLPSDPYSRAMSRLWIDYCNTKWAGAMWALLYNDDLAARERLFRKCVEQLEYIDRGMRALSEGPYWFGSALSLADISFYTLMERFCSYRELAGLSTQQALPTRVSAWFQAMRGRASVQATAKPLEFYAKRYPAWIRTAKTW